MRLSLTSCINVLAFLLFLTAVAAIFFSHPEVAPLPHRGPASVDSPPSVR